MRGCIEQEEKPGIRKRRRRDDVLPSDVDAGEPDGRQHADGGEEQELPGTEAQRTNLR
jgi:hypothetical protein